MSPRIRKARPDDAAAISRLIVALAETHILHEFDAVAGEHFRAAVSPGAIAGYMAAEFRYHVAEDAGGPVGVVATRGDGHLYHLFVAEAAQGRGLARRLWNVARQASRAAGHEGDFTVFSSRHAVGLYEKLGFERDGPDDERHGIVSIPMRFRAGSIERSKPRSE